MLVVFHNGHKGTSGGQAGAGEGVDELGFAAARGAEADIGPAGLEVRAVGAGGDFPVGVLAGEPDFKVIGFGGAKAHVACTQGNGAVGQFQAFQQHFRTAAHGFQLFP